RESRSRSRSRWSRSHRGRGFPSIPGAAGKERAMGDPVLEGLTDTLVNGTMAERREAVRRLAGRGEGAIQPLLALLRQPVGNDARWYAAVALVKIGPAAIGPLIEA